MTLGGLLATAFAALQLGDVFFSEIAMNRYSIAMMLLKIQIVLFENSISYNRYIIKVRICPKYVCVLRRLCLAVHRICASN